MGENKYLNCLENIEKFIKSDMCEGCKEFFNDEGESPNCDECNYKIILDEIEDVKKIKE